MFGKRCVLKHSQRRFFSLSHIPTYGALPLVGSIPYIIMAQRKGVIDFLKANSISYDKLKPIYTQGVPGYGTGIKQLYVMCTDPREYETVIRNEGRNPYGALMSQWPIIYATNQLNHSHKNFFTKGEEWRRFRIPIQKALLSPEAVKGYIPGICKAVALSCDNFDQYAGSIDKFTVCSSFDMFHTVLFGKFSNIVAGLADEATKQFQADVVLMLKELFPIIFSPYDRIMSLIGFPSSRLKRFVQLEKGIKLHMNRIVDEFLVRREQGLLDEYESGSYIALNLDRQEKSDSSLTLQEFKDMTANLMTGSVDTTSTIINWVLFFLALHSEVQSKARQEILQCVSVEGSSQDLVETLIRAKKNLPYLQMVIREVHRLRPALPISIGKTVDKEVVIGGYTVPAGTLCVLDGHSMQNDPELVEDSRKFIPERWSPESVAARKNTPSEVLDHPLIRAPFSEGVRMCPGFRVAQLEVITMVASLLRRWEFTLAPGQGINEYSDLKYVRLATLQPAPMPKFVVKRYIESIQG